MEKSLIAHDRNDSLMKKAPPDSPQPKKFKKYHEEDDGDEDMKRRMNVTHTDNVQKSPFEIRASILDQESN